MHCVQIHEKIIKTVHDFGHFYATLELERCINAVIDCFSFFFNKTNEQKAKHCPPFPLFKNIYCEGQDKCISPHERQVQTDTQNSHMGHQTAQWHKYVTITEGSDGFSSVKVSLFLNPF